MLKGKKFDASALYLYDNFYSIFQGLPLHVSTASNVSFNCY